MPALSFPLPVNATVPSSQP